MTGVYIASVRGGRPSNEDKHNVVEGKRVKMYGVYDGHGGNFVSKFLSVNMPQLFTDPKIKYPLSKSYVNSVFNGVQGVLTEKYKKQTEMCGSTCLIACLCENYLNIVNVGDSRAVMCRKGNIAHVLSLDHKPEWPNEKSRITKMGGKIEKDGDIFRISGLSVSRAMGDLDAKPYVIHTPDLYRYKITGEDKFFILGCDGLWDVVLPQDAVNFVLLHCYDGEGKRINKDTNIAKKLADHAIKMDSGDNVTIIVVFFG